VLFDAVPPSTPTLTAFPGFADIGFNWTSPGDDGMTGDAARWEIRRSTTGPVTNSNFFQSTVATQGVPAPSGQPDAGETLITGCNVNNYFGLRVRDEAFNWSSVASVGPFKRPCVGCAGDGPSSQRDPSALPSAVQLSVGDNPARFSSSLSYGLPLSRGGQPYRLSIYDVAGREVRVLASGTVWPGWGNVRWDLSAGDGLRVPSGIYFAKLFVGATESVSRRVVVVR